jgi:hypothetical protein
MLSFRSKRDIAQYLALAKAQKSNQGKLMELT